MEQNGRIQDMGITAILKQIDENKGFPSIGFEAKKAYARWYFADAVKKGSSKYDSDAEFATEDYAQRVLASELLGDVLLYNKNDVENTLDGFKVPDGLWCIELLETLLFAAIQEPDQPLPYGAVLEKPLTEEMKASYLQSIKTQMEKTRAEVASWDLEQFKSQLKNWVSDAKIYHTTVYTALESIMINFTKTRCDLKTWACPIQITNIGTGKRAFKRGSLPSMEEDETNIIGQSWKIASCIEEALFTIWKNSKESSNFLNKESEEALSSFNDWANGVGTYKDKEKHNPWKGPSNGLAHFCISAECEVNKSALIAKDGVVNYDFGYYQGGVSKKNNGKTDKIRNAMSLSKVFYDPDIIFLFMPYTSSEDKGDASNAMSPSDIWFQSANPEATLSEHYGITAAQWQKFKDSVIQDKKHQKVRLYKAFPWFDQLEEIRNWMIEKDVVNLVDVSHNKECLADILGIIENTNANKTNMETIVGSFGQDTTQQQQGQNQQQPVQQNQVQQQQNQVQQQTQEQVQQQGQVQQGNPLTQLASGVIGNEPPANNGLPVGTQVGVGLPTYN